MSEGNRRQKLIDALSHFSGGAESACPNCGSHLLKIGYIETDKKEQTGFGAFWCEDCRTALILCRANLKSQEMRNKIIPALPADLKFI